MIKNKEEIIQEAVKRFEEKVRDYLMSTSLLDDKENLNIDNFEELWTIMNHEAKEIVEDISNAIISNIDEKDLISKKKLNSPKKE